MKSIVEKMNRCVRPNAPSSAVHTPRFRPKIGVGVNAFGYYTHNWIGRDQYPNVWNGGGGITARIKVVPALCLDMGLNYIRKNFLRDSVYKTINTYEQKVDDQGQIYFVYTSYHYRYDSSLKFRHLQIPIGLTAILQPQKQINLFISGGITLEIPLKEKAERRLIRPYAMSRAAVFTKPDDKGSIIDLGINYDKKVLPGFYVRVGVSKKIKGHNDLSLTFDYFRDGLNGRDNVFYQPLRYQTHRYQLTAGAMHYFGK